MTTYEVVLVRTGVANLASVAAGLRRAGAQVTIADDAASVDRADRLVLPGVGSFAAAMTQLRSRELVAPLAQRIRDGRPTVAICLGLQLLGTASEESPDALGLAAFPACATRFDDRVRVPQLGWNAVRPDAECTWLRPGYAYFANSYRLTACPPGWQAAWADHGGPFVAALERGSILACQFHPELSGQWGVSLLQRWLAATNAEVSPC